jgi:hypothetical protein
VQSQTIKLHSYIMCTMAWMNAMLRTTHIQTVVIAITNLPICVLLSNYFNVHCYSPAVLSSNLLMDIVSYKKVGVNSLSTYIDLFRYILPIVTTSRSVENADLP